MTHINPAGLAAKVDSNGEKVELGMTLVKVNDVHVPPHYGESVLLRADFHFHFRFLLPRVPRQHDYSSSCALISLSLRD